ncbi:PaaI family thioesterase [Aquisalimonas lutea]|uniref:PaaI family thioesterase n=1 Tax=Aquisalimonas lutea TaxID=1327750 RepID=UPI0025B4C5F3|nr:PaaI family thioesterase [Aquisalimonas lutea]MDN3516759.1 PaaI family thioesterase [Aquisalimonas lutea]
MHSFADEEVEELLRQVALTSGYNQWLGARLVAAGNGQVEVELPVRAEMLQHHGFVHGGVIGALADNACAWAAASIAGDVVTNSYTLQLLAPTSASRLRVAGNVIKAGKRHVSVEARVFAERDAGDPKLTAVALASISVVSEGSAA